MGVELLFQFQAGVEEQKYRTDQGAGKGN